MTHGSREEKNGIGLDATCGGPFIPCRQQQLDHHHGIWIDYIETSTVVVIVERRGATIEADEADMRLPRQFLETTSLESIHSFELLAPTCGALGRKNC